MGRTGCTEPQCLYKGALYLTITLFKNNNHNSLSSESCFGLRNRLKAIIISPKIKYLLSNFSLIPTAVLLRKI